MKQREGDRLKRTRSRSPISRRTTRASSPEPATNKKPLKPRTEDERKKKKVSENESNEGSRTSKTTPKRALRDRSKQRATPQMKDDSEDERPRSPLVLRSKRRRSSLAQ